MKQYKVRNDIIGKKVGKLLVLSYNGRNKHNQVLCDCLCECGKTHITLKFLLEQEQVHSCGCFRIERKRKPYGEAAFNILLRNYKRNAKDRNLNWELTIEEFKHLTKQSCYYCDITPSSTQLANSKSGGEYIYNGIDRKDNKKGYTLENCVSCCGTHNTMRMDLALDEFKEHIFKLYFKFLEKEQKSNV